MWTTSRLFVGAAVTLGAIMLVAGIVSLAGGGDYGVLGIVLGVGLLGITALNVRKNGMR